MGLVRVSCDGGSWLRLDFVFLLQEQGLPGSLASNSSRGISEGMMGKVELGSLKIGGRGWESAMGKGRYVMQVWRTGIPLH